MGRQKGSLGQGFGGLGKDPRGGPSAFAGVWK